MLWRIMGDVVSLMSGNLGRSLEHGVVFFSKVSTNDVVSELA